MFVSNKMKLLYFGRKNEKRKCLYNKKRNWQAT